MKLQWHLVENTAANVRTVVSTICVNLKTGRIRLNPPAIELLKLKNKDSIAFAQDEENPGDWYLKKDSKGFTVTIKNDRGTLSAYINSKKLAYNFMQSLSKTQLEYATYKITPEETEGVFPIVTRIPIKEK